MNSIPTPPSINGPELWAARFPWPGRSTHKHARGRLMVVSGGLSSTGAARMAARAGLRVGAGVVTVLSPPAALVVNATALEAIMVRRFDGPDDIEKVAAQADAVVIGPAAGIGEGTIANLAALARTGAALVVDADALTSFQHRPADLFAHLEASDVLTPHAGEFERVFPGLLAEAPDRIAAAREASAQAGAVVLLKGPDTVIAAPDGRTTVNVDAPPWLATAGSGDVLAGLIGGLIAQGRDRDRVGGMDSFEAACCAAWLHAQAAAAFGPGLIAEDLPEQIPGVLRRLYAGR